MAISSSGPLPLARAALERVAEEREGMQCGKLRRTVPAR
jgi:hypothetical protein